MSSCLPVEAWPRLAVASYGRLEVAAGGQEVVLLASCGLLWLARGLLLLTAACWRWLDLALALRKGSNKVDSDVWLLSSGAAGL